MAAPKPGTPIKPKSGVPYFLKKKKITVEELHKLSLHFENEHKKDMKGLSTLNAAQLYLKQYWAFYLSKGKQAQLMNDKIKQFFDKNEFSECFIMYQLAINAREVMLDNKIKLPYGNGDKPTDVELRGLMPHKPKVAQPNSPPDLKSNNNQILALFASLQNDNNV
eukprot:521856_1